MDSPVCSRTRSREALLFRKMHEQILRKKCEHESYSFSRRSKDLKNSSNSSCGYDVEKHSSNSLSFDGFEGKRKGRKRRNGFGSGSGSGSSQNDNVGKEDFVVFGDDSAKDSNLGSAEFDLGSSNFESDCIKKVPMDVEESCSGTKIGNLGSLHNDEDEEEVVIISDGSVEGDSEEEDEFQVSSSEESENDDEEDEDYREGEHSEKERPSDISSDELISSGNEEDEKEEEEIEIPSSKKIDERGKRGKLESPLSRRKRFQVSSDAEDDVIVVENDTKMVERDKRGNLESPLSNRKILEVSSDGEDDVIVVEDDVEMVRVGDTSKRKKFRLDSKTRNSKINIVEILGNSMFNDDEEEEEVVIPPPEPPTLPQKFKFGVFEPPPVEKTAEEMEEEALWAEMNLALYAEDTDYHALIGNEAATSANVESTIEEDCSRGKHVLVLEEEIGLICKYCGFVRQEIRDYTVPFNKNPFGISERRGSHMEHVDANGKLHLHDFEDDAREGVDFRSNVRGTVWELIPGLGKDLHPHQRDGFEFLWKNIGGGIELDKLKEPGCSDKGMGCIISHAPGTGKTRLAIMFLESYMKLYPSCKPVIIAPCGMLLYWESEFKKWNVKIPFHNLNHHKLSGKENEAALRLVRSRHLDRYSVRMVKLYSWKKDKSVLALSYKLFEELVGERLKTKDVNVQKVLVEVPSLLVLDEGHTPRNDQSQIWKALSKIQTTKRIILSGTPFQNNFDELYNTICLARPQFADFFSDEPNECFAYRRPKHSAKKKWNSLTNPIGKEDTNLKQKAKRLEQVRNLISPFVHVHEGNILQHKLPGLRDAVIILQPDELQKRLLDKVKEEESLRHFEMEYLVSVVSVHPSLLPEKLNSEIGTADISRLKSLKLDADAGVKTKFLMELIRISVHLSEKVLVFSQYLEPLKLIIQQLIRRFEWMEGKEILCIDGSTEPLNRQILIKNFNNERNEAKVMLASTKACSEGINLVGASRVVLLDVVWNPSVERQAICRAYRLGQTKVVHIYHLLTCGTMEENKYCRQAKKERLSDLVFYSSERAQNHEKLSSEISDDKKDKILEAMVEGNKLRAILKKIVYEPKVNFNVSFGLVSQ